MTSDWSLHAEPGKASACGYELWWPQSREGDALQRPEVAPMES